MAEEVHLQELTEDNILHGYVPDNRYDIESMEGDGEYSEELDWKYTDLNNEVVEETYPNYNGDDLCICPNASRHFDTVLSACEVAGGFTYEFMKQLTANSNAYACAKVVDNKHKSMLLKQ